MCEVLMIMRESHLSCKPIKYQFEQQSVKYLGMIIGYSQTAINPKKAEVIAEWPTPWNLKDVGSQVAPECRYPCHLTKY
jgi:hypothetical protein